MRPFAASRAEAPPLRARDVDRVVDRDAVLAPCAHRDRRHDHHRAHDQQQYDRSGHAARGRLQAFRLRIRRQSRFPESLSPSPPLPAPIERGFQRTKSSYLRETGSGRASRAVLSARRKGSMKSTVLICRRARGGRLSGLRRLQSADRAAAANRCSRRLRRSARCRNRRSSAARRRTSPQS